MISLCFRNLLGQKGLGSHNQRDLVTSAAQIWMQMRNEFDWASDCSEQPWHAEFLQTSDVRIVILSRLIKGDLLLLIQSPNGLHGLLQVPRKWRSRCQDEQPIPFGAKRNPTANALSFQVANSTCPVFAGNFCEFSIGKWPWTVGNQGKFSTDRIGKKGKHEEKLRLVACCFSTLSQNCYFANPSTHWA